MQTGEILPFRLMGGASDPALGSAVHGIVAHPGPGGARLRIDCTSSAGGTLRLRMGSWQTRERIPPGPSLIEVEMWGESVLEGAQLRVQMESLTGRLIDLATGRREPRVVLDQVWVADAPVETGRRAEHEASVAGVPTSPGSRARSLPDALREPWMEVGEGAAPPEDEPSSVVSEARVQERIRKTEERRFRARVEKQLGGMEARFKRMQSAITEQDNLVHRVRREGRELEERLERDLGEQETLARRVDQLDAQTLGAARESLSEEIGGVRDEVEEVRAEIATLREGLPDGARVSKVEALFERSERALFQARKDVANVARGAVLARLEPLLDELSARQQTLGSQLDALVRERSRRTWAELESGFEGLASRQTELTEQLDAMQEFLEARRPQAARGRVPARVQRGS